MLSIISAVAKNNVIGAKNDLPWYLPADLRHFKDITTGHVVIMGKNTFLSIFDRLKGPLPNRTNIVLTSSPDTLPDGFIAASSLEAALKHSGPKDTVFIIGGASVYEQTINLADQLVITHVDADIAGDTYFPPIDSEIWVEIDRQSYTADQKNPYNYSFATYIRR